VNWWAYETPDALIQNYYPNKQGYVLDCYLYGPLTPASTRFAILGNLPNTLTLGSAAPLVTQYGMPLLYVYDKTGNVVTTETATSVSSDGTQATFPFPSSLTQSGYSLAIVNQVGGNLGFVPAGDNLLSIASSQTVAGNPFGVSVGALTDNSTFCKYYPPIPPSRQPVEECTPSSSYNTFPVVSLYAQNQVLINSTAVSVGLNPTAVAAYQAGSITKTFGLLTETFSGTTRAIVAN
jgi:hypothetical protein